LKRLNALTSENRVHLRPATAADIPRIMSLERQSATAGHWTVEQYRQLFQSERPARLLLVAEAARAGEAASYDILGFLIAHHLAPEWELENIVVAPTARRKGLGRRLLGALFAAARNTNSSSVFLEVRESNAAARALYEKAAFGQTGRRHSYYTSPLEDAILYRRTLD
jgi:ribosomal-protein-alanine N-acetyltransferase